MTGAGRLSSTMRVVKSAAGRGDVGNLAGRCVVFGKRLGERQGNLMPRVQGEFVELRANSSGTLFAGRRAAGKRDLDAIGRGLRVLTNHLDGKHARIEQDRDFGLLTIDHAHAFRSVAGMDGRSAQPGA